jgi:hypothetical protein
VQLPPDRHIGGVEDLAGGRRQPAGATLKAVANTQWLDRTQPQTLQMANMLLYIYVAIWLLQLLAFGVTYFSVLAVGAIFAGVGIANDKRAGYWGAVVVAALNLLLLLQLFMGGGNDIGTVINLVFGAALLALLLHPMSRSYQRIWFKSLKSHRRR